MADPRYVIKTIPGGFALFKDGTYVERVSEDGIISNRPLKEGEYEKFIREFRRQQTSLNRALQQAVGDKK